MTIQSEPAPASTQESALIAPDADLEALAEVARDVDAAGDVDDYAAMSEANGRVQHEEVPEPAAELARLLRHHQVPRQARPA